MSLPDDFNKIYGSTATGGLTPISDVNYANGWEFVGANPPTKNDFSYLQNLSDKKSQWLYSNKLQRTDPFGDIKSDGAGAVSKALENLGLGDSNGYMGRLINVQVISASATYTKTAGAKKGKIIITGGGAGGSKAGVFSASGGAGGTRIAFIPLPDTAQVTIGAGGTGVSSGGPGNAGGNSSFGTLMTAEGGKPTGKGGSSSGEGFGIAGGNGNSGDMQSSNSFGGASYWGGGGSAYSATDATILSARAPGAGGASISSIATTSGAGAAGICIIEEYA